MFTIIILSCLTLVAYCAASIAPWSVARKQGTKYAAKALARMASNNPQEYEVTLKSLQIQNLREDIYSIQERIQRKCNTEAKLYEKYIAKLKTPKQ